MTTSKIWVPAYVGLGSNLENPQLQVETALVDLTDIPETRVVTQSKLYRTRPLGDEDQPDFVNAVAAILTILSVDELFRRLLNIEKKHGRERDGTKWGPRTLDLDLLVFGTCRVTTGELTVPHPGIPERSFVLYPLADIAAELEIPGLGAVRDLLENVSAEGIKVIPAGKTAGS